MNEEAKHALALLMQEHPFPYYFDQNNAYGVTVKDCMGEVVYRSSFSYRKGAGKSAHFIKTQRSIRTLAYFLVALSNERP